MTTNKPTEQEAPERLEQIRERYKDSATPSATYQVRANDLAWLINEVESRSARVDTLAAPTEARCADCQHSQSTYDYFLRRCNVLIAGSAICGCNCGWIPKPAPAAPDERDRVLAQETVDSFRFGHSPVQSLRFLEWEPLVTAFTTALAAVRKETWEKAITTVKAMRDQHNRDYEYWKSIASDPNDFGVLKFAAWAGEDERVITALESAKQER